MMDYGLEYDRMVRQSNRQQEIIERQHKAIVKLRGALDYYVTQDGIAEGYSAGIGGVALFNAEQALKDTEDLA